ncbi:MAG: hypothetical protein DYH08_04155 [Actinobacteria bacterium ATB1]|nr:hypothetical protein [Actinobacteria bacterium ATB1]
MATPTMRLTAAGPDMIRARCRGCGRDLQRRNGPSGLGEICYWCAQRAVAAERRAFLDRVRTREA